MWMYIQVESCSVWDTILRCLLHVMWHHRMWLIFSDITLLRFTDEISLRWLVEDSENSTSVTSILLVPVHSWQMMLAFSRYILICNEHVPLLASSPLNGIMFLALFCTSNIPYCERESDSNLLNLPLPIALPGQEVWISCVCKCLVPIAVHVLIMAKNLTWH